MENEIKIMDGLAKIKRCKNSNIWQFIMWIKKEKQYYRLTTGTRNKEQAIERSDPLQLNKGGGAALACLSLINHKNTISYE